MKRAKTATLNFLRGAWVESSAGEKKRQQQSNALSHVFEAIRARFGSLAKKEGNYRRLGVHRTDKVD